MVKSQYALAGENEFDTPTLEELLCSVMCSQCSTTVLLRIGVLKDFAKANGNIARVSRALVCRVFRVTCSSSVSVLIEYCEIKKLLFFHHLLEIRKAYLPCNENSFIQNTKFCDDVERASNLYPETGYSLWMCACILALPAPNFVPANRYT